MKSQSIPSRAGKPLATGLLVAAFSLLSCHGHRHETVVVSENFVVVSSGPELEPNDESASPNYLGVLRQGQEMIVTGHAQAPDPLLPPGMDPLEDEFDGFAISLTQPSEIEFRLTFDDSSGELDTWIYDPALVNPPGSDPPLGGIAIYYETDFSPETGVFNVFDPVLDFHIVVRAFSGESNYTLEVFARPISSFASTADAGSEPSGVLAAGASGEVLRSGGAEVALGRGAATARYLGRELPADEDSPGRRTGTAFAVLEDGTVLTAPIFTVGPGLRAVIPN